LFWNAPETGAETLAIGPQPSPPAVKTAPAHDEPVLARLIDFLERTFPQAPRPLSAGTTLPDAVLADSLSYLEVVMFLETEFDLSFEPRDLEGTSFETPQAIAALVERKLMDSR
jgi:acyl carrier protein